MGKLVRDGIPDIIRGSRRRPLVRTLGDEDFLAALHAKLHEESAELRAAGTPQDVAAELADLLEVLDALAGYHHMSLAAVAEVARAKRRECGGFDMRLWLDGVDVE